MPYRIVDTGKQNARRYTIINKQSGKVAAHAPSREKAELFIGFATAGERKDKK